MRYAVTLLAMALMCGSAHASRDWPEDYDAHFRKYTKRYFGPNFDWRWFKAQAIAESSLKPDAQSHVGAVGIMQIMPATFAEIRAKNPHYTDISDPRWNIAAGIYYDRYLYRQKSWARLSDYEKLCLTFAGYNAGLGGALKAKRRTPPPADRWEHIRPQAPKETQNYVARIQRFKQELE